MTVSEIPDDTVYVVVGSRTRYINWVRDQGWHENDPSVRCATASITSFHDMQYLRGGRGPGKRWVLVNLRPDADTDLLLDDAKQYVDMMNALLSTH